MTNIEPAAPLIEILYPRYEVINGSFSIAKLLVQKFPPEDGYKKLEGVDVIEQYLDEIPNIAQAILKYIVYDTYKNALDPYDGSKRHYKRKMEGMMKCKLSNVMANCREAEAAVLQEIRDAWLPLRERMKTEDENTEREFIPWDFPLPFLLMMIWIATYKDFLDASLMKRVEAASPSKYRVLLMLYGDDTLTKLMGRVEKYSS